MAAYVVRTMGRYGDLGQILILCGFVCGLFGGGYLKRVLQTKELPAAGVFLSLFFSVALFPCQRVVRE